VVASTRDSGAGGRLVARAEARRRWPSLLGLAVLVALVVTAVLALAGGARRTATVVDRYLDETAARDYSAFSFGVFGSGGEDALPPATDALRQLEAAVREVDGVDEVGGSVGFPTGASAEFDFTIFSSPEDTMFSTIDRPVVREGRLPAAGAANEVALNEVSAELLGVGVGDVIEAPTFALADCEALLGGTEFPGFNGPLLRLEVVGRVLLPDDLRGVEAESGPIGVGSPAFAGRYDEEVCSTVIYASIRVGDDDPGIAAIQEAVDGASVGAEIALAASTEDDFENEARSAIHVVVVVLVLLAAVAAIAGLATAAQGVRRQASASTTTAAGRTLAALGMTRHQRAQAVGAPIALAVLVGTLAGAVGAYLASAWFPVSLGRRIEPDPGLSADLVVLVGGALAIALFAMAWAYVVSRSVEGVVANRVVTRPSQAAEGAARLGLPPPAVIGLRLAYEGGSARPRVPVRSALAGASLAVIGVVAVVTFSASLDETMARPERYGWTWSSMPDFYEGDADVAIETIAQDERIDAVARLVGGSVDLDDGGRVQAFGIEDRVGVTDFTVLAGRAPRADDEVALGATLMSEAGVAIGDRVVAVGADGDNQELTVVGEAIVPLVDDNVEPGNGLLLTVPALRSLVRGEVQEKLIIRYREGVDAPALERDLVELGYAFPGYADPRPPSRLANLGALDGVFLALAVFLALLGAVGLTHALIVSARRHRTSFAALRAIGFVRGQVRRVLVWQAAAIALVAVVVGVTLGVVAGRVAWTVAVANLGIIEVMAVPMGAVALVAAGALAGAVLLALVPAVIATRGRPAEALRTE